MKNMSLSKLMYSGLFFVFFILSSVFTFSIWKQYQIINITENIYNHPFTVSHSARNIKADVTFMWEIVTKMVYQNLDNNHANDLLTLQKQIEVDFDTIKARYLGDYKDIEDTHLIYEDLKYTLQSAISIYEHDGKEKTIAFLKSQNVEDMYKNFIIKIDTIINFAYNKAKEFKASTQKKLKQDIQEQIFLMILFLILIALVLFRLFKGVKKEFEEIGNVVDSIKDNKFEKIQTISGLFEFTKLKQAINKMVDAISKYQEDVSIKTKRLEKNQKKYIALMESATDGIYVTDKNGNIVEFSHSFAQMLGYSIQEMHSLNIKDFDVYISKDTIDSFLQELISGSNKIFNTKHKCKDGTILDIEINARGMIIDGENFLYASARDITQRLKIEKQLLESETKFSDMFKTHGSVMLLVDPKFGKIIDANNSAAKFYGYSIEELKNMNVSDINMDSVDIVQKKREEAFTHQKNYFIFKHTLKNGETRDVEVYSSPVSTPQGKLLFSIVRDITEQKNLEEKLQNLNTELENKVQQQVEELYQKEQMMLQQSKMAAMGEMIGNIAHQWRQPLNVLMIKKDIIVEDFEDANLTQEKMEKYSEDTNKLLLYLSKTIDDFRNFFKPSKEKKAFDVHKAIQDAIDITISSLNSKNIKIIFNKWGEFLTINGYESEFKQVIINLINNAKDAIVNNNKNGFIKIAVVVYNGNVKITVKDNAGGIQNDTMDRIFEPYFTTKFKSQGTGLGLYISKTIINTNMNGSILAENIEDGAMFTILLPMKEE